MTDSNKTIKILYKADLELQTALHIGCAQKSPVGSFEMMQNGAGEYIIPGTSIAGVFIETLRDFLKLEGKQEEMSFLFARCSSDNNTIYLVPTTKSNQINKFHLLNPVPEKEKIKLGRTEDEYFVLLENLYHDEDGKIKNEYKDVFNSIKKYRQNFGSPLIFRSVNLTESIKEINDKIKIRNRTKIDRETKTADDGALFSYWEIEPENVNFEVKIEIDNLSVKNSDEDIKTLQNWIKLVFASWKNEGVFFGAHNTSGNGYCKMQKVEEWVIDSEEDFENYLDNRANFNEVSDYPPKVENRYKTLTITVDMSDEDDGYGTNALLIKGGVSHTSCADNKSDAVFINTGNRLFIPGSSLKGTFSMFLEKYGHKDDWLKEFFGQEGSKNQGYIYFPDLIIEHTAKDKEINYDVKVDPKKEPESIKNHLVNIERHAEDEFTRAVFGSGKFNEERLFHAKTTGQIRVPIDFYEKHKNSTDKQKGLNDLFEFMKKGCEHRLISLGANGCYPKITIEEDK